MNICQDNFNYIFTFLDNKNCVDLIKYRLVCKSFRNYFSIHKLSNCIFIQLFNNDKTYNIKDIISSFGDYHYSAQDPSIYYLTYIVLEQLSYFLLHKSKNIYIHYHYRYLASYNIFNNIYPNYVHYNNNIDKIKLLSNLACIKNQRKYNINRVINLNHYVHFSIINISRNILAIVY